MDDRTARWVLFSCSRRKRYGPTSHLARVVIVHSIDLDSYRSIIRLREFHSRRESVRRNWPEDDGNERTFHLHSKNDHIILVSWSKHFACSIAMRSTTRVSSSCHGQTSGCRSLPVDPMIGLHVRTNTTMGKQLNADTTYCGYFWNESFFSMDNDISRISNDRELCRERS